MTWFVRWLFVACTALAFVGCGDDDDDACYSPTQNVESAYAGGGHGCACDSQKDKDVCVHGTALTCESDRWLSVQDGPCLPPPPPPDSGTPHDAGDACYSPTQNVKHAHDNGTTGCACDSKTDKDVCVQGVPLICEHGRWRAVIDGPCFGPPRPDSGTPNDNDAGDTDAGDDSDGGSH